MKSDYIFKQEFQHILAALTSENRLALETSLATGLRIGDILNLRAVQLKPRFTLRESKTGKNRQIRLPNDLLDRLLSISGKIYVFEHRLDYHKHRTRQAVWKDLKRASKLFRIPSDLNLSCHSARKIYAVGQYKRTCDIRKVKELLNHSDEAVTYIYAMADVLTKRNHPNLKLDDI